MPKLTVGDEAPDFELQNQDGKLVTLSQFRGQKSVVLFFYPKDETPGCIKEVCGFRDHYEDFLTLGAEVLGVSSDSVSSHKLFRLSRRLPFPLLSDAKGKVRKAYGVAGSLLGLVPGRETFIIDPKGIIRHRFSSQFQIEQHIEQAMQTVKQIEMTP